MKCNLALCLREEQLKLYLSQEGCRNGIMPKEKLYMCPMCIEKAFDRVPRIELLWAMSEKGIPDVLVRSVMSLYKGAKTRDRVDSELSEEFEAKVGMYQISVLSPFPFAAVVDVVTYFENEPWENQGSFIGQQRNLKGWFV